MKAVIIDGNILDIHSLSKELEIFEGIEVLASFEHPLDALNNIKELKPDVLFVEVEIGSYNIVDMVPWFYDVIPDLRVVFVTENDRFAVKAFEVGAIDYLIKPVHKKRLMITITNLRKRIEVPTQQKVMAKSFGSFELYDKNGEIVRWRTRKSKELFIYLWLHSGTTVSRDIILETIFPSDDLKQSGGLLNTTVYQLRQNLFDLFGDGFLEYINNGYQLNVSIRSDYETVLSIITSSEYSLANFKQIKSLYSGDFLSHEGYEWATVDTEKITSKVKNYLVEMVKFLRKVGEIREVENVSLFIYELDKLDEHTVIRILDYYYEFDLSSKMKYFYSVYKQNVHDLIGAEPSNNVIERYHQHLNSINKSIEKIKREKNTK